MQKGEVLVIDLFAGPGGLGEGISSCVHENGNKPFEIGVSVEKEPSAHKTLTTRAFFRKISNNKKGRNDYYQYVRGHITREELFQKYPTQAEQALDETLRKPQALGLDNELIHSRIKKLVGEHSGAKIVIGGPPCQAYSLAGRSRNAGNAEYKAEDDNRHFLYKEYLKVISIAQPELFIMENVRGILSAKVDGKLMFPQILEDLRKPGIVSEIKNVPNYRIYSLVATAEDQNNPQYTDSADFLIRSEKYGIPQARHRVILIGVREDLKPAPGTLALAEQYPVTVQETIGDLPPLRSGFSKQEDDSHTWEKTVSRHARRLEKILEKSHPDEIKQLDLSPQKDLLRQSSIHTRIKQANMPKDLKKWLIDDNLDCVLNHATRGHMVDDLLRYAFCASYAKLNNGTSPKSKNFPKELAPNHVNWESGKHADRFRVQSGTKAATTVTSHISKDGHYFVHYDPQQCRSLTVREAARLQTFPDNYLFEGNRTQQYVQVGNAVPPFLAQQIGKIIIKVLK
jgi:DNA (cytosine-5)-methyltransferase 1